MHIDPQHKTRIISDLKKAGVTQYGLFKAEAAELPNIIAKDETIYGCIYGQYGGGSAMMVATDRRFIFLDKKPLHLFVEEMAFEKVNDIGADWQPLFSRVTVNTRAGKYVFRYVNSKCARIFVSYMETAVLGLHTNAVSIEDKTGHYRVTLPKNFSLEESQFATSHYMCVVSTLGDDGYPYGATMFYFTDPSSSDVIRLVTRSSTPTAQNVRHRNRIALTITDTESFATMHVAGIVTPEQDAVQATAVLQKLLVNNPNIPKNGIPPVAQIKDGSYVVLKISVTRTSLKTYKTK